MKHLVLLLGIMLSSSAVACDICSMYMRLGLNDFQSSIGLNFRSQYFSGTFYSMDLPPQYRHFNPDELISYSGKEVRELYQVVELRGEYFLSERFSMQGFLPVKSVRRTVQGEKDMSLTKWTDPSLLFKYRLVNSKSTESNNWFYRVNLGIGAKAPMGGTQNYQNGQYVNPDLQPGSGSYDLLGAVEFAVAYKFIGVSGNIIHKECLPNKGDYQFGNSRSSQWSFFGIIQTDNKQFMPAVGLYTENEETDFWEGVEQESSASNRVFISYGGEITWNRVSISGYYQDNVKSEFTGVQLGADKRLVFGLQYFVN